MNKKVPSYYIGKNKQIKAHEIISDYELTYNIGTAVTYLLRAGKKPNNPAKQDIQKAIDHLQFELDTLENNQYIINENANSTY
ncbi:MAG: hypothetical protein GOVbin568_25 [Prokaryotic dsDNA virus sp.]|nr:MAG: hypothetical protein GOVbin568_25 [Prokaryotic dsDNA virus sp.]|tara:strand:+ start:9719 stop:9967 length:249 start_codon:yes stop_codon:yes gene_type:complete